MRILYQNTFMKRLEDCISGKAQHHLHLEYIVNIWGSFKLDVISPSSVDSTLEMLGIVSDGLTVRFPQKTFFMQD